MVQRVVYRRQCSYNTRSNKIRKVKTPGGRILAQHTPKKATIKKCAETGQVLNGISNKRATQYRNLAKRKRTVSRAYGGTLSHTAVRERIIRAFITEEVKIVKKVLASQPKKAKK